MDTSEVPLCVLSLGRVLSSRVPCWCVGSQPEEPQSRILALFGVLLISNSRDACVNGTPDPSVNASVIAC